MSPISAPPLRLALRPDRILPAARIAGLSVLAAAAIVYAFLYSTPAWTLAPLTLALIAGLWTRHHRPPHWDWLGCDTQAQWWLATREGLRQEQRTPIQVLPETRVTVRLVVLILRPLPAGPVQVLWLPWWRLHPEDFRRLRVRLRWPSEWRDNPGWAAWLQAGRAGLVAILGRRKRPDLLPMSTTRELPAVDHLLSDDPEHTYSEDELDAIEAIDPELALRLDRAQTFASRQATEVVAEGPIDEDVVRQAIDEARRILMQDGGDIEYVGLDGRTVQVRLKGACVGCPRSALDLRNVVERLVRSRAPGVERVANTF